MPARTYSPIYAVIDNPQDGDHLIYNSTAKRWENNAGGGGGGNGIFDVANDGGSVSSAFIVNLTDYIRFNGKIITNTVLIADHTHALFSDGITRHGIQIVHDSVHESVGNAVDIQNIGTTAPSNVALKLTASGAASNVALDVAAGNVSLRNGVKFKIGGSSFAADFTIKSQSVSSTNINILNSTGVSDIFQVKETSGGHGQLIIMDSTGVSDITLDLNGIAFNPGSDIDADLIIVGVTGDPKIYWDESEHAFSITSTTTAALALNSASGSDMMLRFYENSVEKARLQYDVAPTDNLSIRFPTGSDVVMAWYPDGEIKVIDNGETNPAISGNSFSMWAADVAGAGTSSFHIKNELNDIMKIFADGGWALPTGTSTKTTFVTSTVTTEQLAERVKALIEHFFTTAGLGILKA